MAAPPSPSAANPPPTLEALLHALEQAPVHTAQPALELLKQLKPFAQANAHLRLFSTLSWVLKHHHHLEVLKAALQLVCSTKALFAVGCLMDLALATQLDVFENPLPEAPPYGTLVNQEAMVRLRCQAIKQLGLLGDDQAIVPLMGLLNDKKSNYRLRLEAAEALGRLKHPGALNPLLQVLKDDRESSLYLRESAAKALGLLGDIRALEPLLDLFENQQGFRKKAEFLLEQVVTSLGRLGQQQTSAMAKQKVVASLLKALGDKASAIRLASLEALGDIASAEQLPAIAACVYDDNMDVAHAALVAVFRVGGAPALRSLLAQDTLPHFIRQEVLDFLVLQDDAADEE